MADIAQALIDAKLAFKDGRHREAPPQIAALIMQAAALPPFNEGEKLIQWVTRNPEHEKAIVQVILDLVAHYGELFPLCNEGQKLKFSIPIFSAECLGEGEKVYRQLLPKQILN